MPFSGPNDAKLPDNVKRLSERKRRQWVAIWNSAWERCRDDDGDTDECERRAFAQANGVVLKSNMQFISNAVQMAEARRVNRGGREFLIVPAVMIAKSEQVLNGELVTVDEIAKFPETWNGRPVTLGHPKRAGQHVSAGSPEIHDTEVIGWVWNTTRNGSVRSEIWIDLAKAEALGSDAMLAVQRLEAGEVINVSTGYFRDVEERAGYLDGEPYHGVARNIRPDHLAILLHEQGACSVQDGCGAPRANQEGDMSDDVQANRRRVWTVEQARRWLENHEFSTDSMEKTANFFAFLQASPRKFDDFRTDPAPFGFEIRDGVVVTFGIKGAGEDRTSEVQSIKFYHGEEDSETTSAIRSNEGAISALKEALRYLVYGPQQTEGQKGVKGMTEEERQALIEQIVANADWEAEELEDIEDSTLRKIAAMAEQSEEEPEEEEPEEELGEQPPAWAEALSERLERLETALQANEARAKQEIIERVKGNPLNPFEDDDLEAMSVNQLASLAEKLIVPNYAGAAGVPLDLGQKGEVKAAKPMPALNKLLARTRPSSHGQEGAND